MQKSRVLDFESEKDWELYREPHIGLWLPCPKASLVWPEIYQPNQDWYVTLTWRTGEQVGGQINLSDCQLYPQAYSTAIAWGKKLGIPVIKHGDISIWVPDSEQTQEQKEMVQDLMNGEKKACTL